MINTRNHGTFLRYAWLILGASAECISLAGNFGQRKAQPSQWEDWTVGKCQVLRQKEPAPHPLRWEQCPNQPFLPQAFTAAGVGSEDSATAFPSSPPGGGNSRPPGKSSLRGTNMWKTVSFSLTEPTGREGGEEEISVKVSFPAGWDGLEISWKCK